MRNIRNLLLSSILILAGCRLPEIKKEAPFVNKIKKGTKFRVNLPEDHRTGGTWRLKPDFNHNRVKQISEVWHGNEEGIDFNLKAASSGKTTLFFIQRKYTDTMSYKTFIVEITDN
jgi:hypothetical protein